MTAKKSLYLKYRPTQLKDVVGQQNVVATLKQASERQEFAHSYLFSGNHGCGKTSTARILATLMTCNDIKDGQVCGKCRACKGIHVGASLDVKELDGATKRKIEDIRELIEGASWSPNELKRKIYIIDEVHQLTKEAISALLKIVEEPPSYLTFILCTTEIKKILPTILSRCQRFNFTKITSKDITGRLALIAKKEGIDIEEEGLVSIAKMARGSMRDAIGYLDQVATVGANKRITSNGINKYFGMVDRKAIYSILKAILSGNIPVVLDQVNDMIMAAADINEILFEISDAFRSAMIIKAQKGESRLIDLPDYEIEELKKISEKLTMGQLLKLARLFSDVEKKINFNINERWVMEATLINCVAVLRQQ
jgi:DNA polymerase-3 subunit gamma/tau